MGKTIRHEKVEPPEGAIEVLISEQRGIDSPMPRTEHLQDRCVRYMPFEAPGDGRDHGHNSEKRAQKRRNRQIKRAICKEYQF